MLGYHPFPSPGAETAAAAEGTHPTGMHSLLFEVLLETELIHFPKISHNKNLDSRRMRIVRCSGHRGSGVSASGPGDVRQCTRVKCLPLIGKMYTLEHTSLGRHPALWT